MGLRRSVQLGVCGRGRWHGPSSIRLDAALLIMDGPAQSEYEQTTSCDEQKLWANFTFWRISQHIPSCPHKRGVCWPLASCTHSLVGPDSHRGGWRRRRGAWINMDVLLVVDPSFVNWSVCLLSDHNLTEHVGPGSPSLVPRTVLASGRRVGIGDGVRRGVGGNQKR